MPVILPILLVGAGVGIIVALALGAADRPVPEHDEDLPPNAPPPAGFPKSTRYKLVDKILPLLQQASESSRIPLGLLVGWIAKESGGKIAEVTPKYNERGFFQLMPDESKGLGLDHERLSTDPVYSINGGLALIGKYMKQVDALNLAPKGSTYYWMLVKLCHTMGTGAVQKIVAAAKAAGAAKTWSQLETFALDHEQALLSATKHSPTKWFPFVDKIYQLGAPFGFGNTDVVVGGEVFADIIDPLDCLK